MKEEGAAVDGKGKAGPVEAEAKDKTAKLDAAGDAAETEGTAAEDARPRVDCELCGRRMLRVNIQEHLRRVHRAPGRPCTSCSLHHTCTKRARGAGGVKKKR